MKKVFYYIQHLFDKGDIEKLTLSNILMQNICESFASTRIGAVNPSIQFCPGNCNWNNKARNI